MIFKGLPAAKNGLRPESEPLKACITHFSIDFNTFRKLVLIACIAKKQESTISESLQAQFIDS